MSSLYCRLLAVTLALLSTDIMSAVNPDHTQPRSIQVNGIGKAYAPPDKADITLVVEAQAKTVELARNQSAATMSTVLQSIKEAGIADRDIQTRAVSLYPNYSPDTANKVIGYQSNNQIVVAVRDLNKASALIDDAVRVGGNAVRLQGISFSLANPEDVLVKAREKAFANAKAKAEQYAKLANVTLDAPLQISEGGDTSHGPIIFGDTTNMRAAIADRVSMPLQPGEQEILVVVDVLFGIH
jgi:uncharacterized protein